MQQHLLRLPSIIGDKEKGIPPLIPVCRSTWFAGIKSGRFPQPVKLSERITAWRAEEVFALLEKK